MGVIASAALLCALPNMAGAAMSGSWQANQFSASADGFLEIGKNYLCNASPEHFKLVSLNSANEASTEDRLAEAKLMCSILPSCAGFQGSPGPSPSLLMEYSLVVPSRDSITGLYRAVLDRSQLQETTNAVCYTRISDARGLAWFVDDVEDPALYMSPRRSGPSNQRIETICKGYFDTIPETVIEGATAPNTNDYVEVTAHVLSKAGEIFKQFHDCKAALYPNYSFIGAFIFLQSDRVPPVIDMNCQYYFDGLDPNAVTRPPAFSTNAALAYTVGFNPDSAVFCLSPNATFFRTTTTSSSTSTSSSSNTTTSTRTATTLSTTSRVVFADARRANDEFGTLIPVLVFVAALVGMACCALGEPHKPDSAEISPKPNSDEIPLKTIASIDDFL